MSAFLVLLLLSNSSLALEIISHDNHPHVQQHAITVVTDVVTGTYSEQQAPQLADSIDESCICDDICCVSSVDVGAISTDNSQPRSETASLANIPLYQSISLDLLLPPPTS